MILALTQVKSSRQTHRLEILFD